MSKPIKIATLLAALFGGAVVAYHMIQSNGSDESVPAVSASSKDTPRQKPNRTVNPDDERVGIGDLMSRIRGHIDTIDQTPDDAKPLPKTAAAPVAEPVPSPAQQPQKLDNPIKPDVAAAPPPVVDTPVTAAPSVAVISPEPDKADTETALPTRTRTLITNTAPPPEPTPSSDNPSGVVLAGDTLGDTRALKENMTDRVTPQKEDPVRHPRIKIRGDFPKTYAIQPGDTFTTIAVKLYGSEAYWLDIAIANPFVDPKRLQIGQTIRLPAPEDILEPAGESPPLADQGSQVTHKVRPDDSLSSIAKQYYHDSSLWRAIYDHNRDLIGPDPDRLTVGQVLDIPPQFIPAQ